MSGSRLLEQLRRMKKRALALALFLALLSGYLIVDYLGVTWRVLRKLCSEGESAGICLREWIGPISALIAMVAIWYAARSVIEASRASDAAVRSTLDSFRSHLLKERDLLRAAPVVEESRSLERLRSATRGGWIHAGANFRTLEPVISECDGFPSIKQLFETPVFGGELGQRRRELGRLIDAINLDYWNLRRQYKKDKKVSSDTLDNIRFRTKAFLGMLHYYQVVVDEEIDVTAEAINQFDDENLRRVRGALLHRAERRWEKRRKGFFERFVDRITVPISLIDRPKTGDYFEDELGLSPRTPSPHHVNRDFELIPKGSRSSRASEKPKEQ